MISQRTGFIYFLKWLGDFKSRTTYVYTQTSASTPLMADIFSKKGVFLIQDVTCCARMMAEWCIFTMFFVVKLKMLKYPERAHQKFTYNHPSNRQVLGTFLFGVPKTINGSKSFLIIINISIHNINNLFFGGLEVYTVIRKWCGKTPNIMKDYQTLYFYSVINLKTEFYNVL